jgi:hypothetical protein
MVLDEKELAPEAFFDTLRVGVDPDSNNDNPT